jgi:hypothetical protein
LYGKNPKFINVFSKPLKRNEDFNILWYVDPLLGNNREVGDGNVVVARQRPANNNSKRMVFSEQGPKQQLKSNRGRVFSLRFVPRCYKQDNWSNELVVGQSPASKDVNMEAQGSTVLEAVTRQPVKIQQTENT